MKAQVVSFRCVLKDTIGKVISSTINHDVITQIEKPGRMLKGLAEVLQALGKGDKRSVCISAEQAYGFYNPDLVIEISRKKLLDGESLEIGQQVMAQSDDGESQVFRVTGVSGNLITLDANHPLAGQDLVFEIETIEKRDATLEEIAESCVDQSNPYFH